MDNKKTFAFLNEELDDESVKYLNELVNSWKEEMMELMYKEVEEKNAAKLEALIKENLALREELKEYSKK